MDPRPRSQLVVAGAGIGAAASLCTALADYGALWLWIATWGERLEVLLRMLAFQLPLGALVGGAIGACETLRRAGTLARSKRRWPLPFVLLLAPMLLDLALRLFDGGKARTLEPLWAFKAGAFLILLGGTYTGLRVAGALHAWSERSPRVRRTIALGLLALFVAVTKIDQTVLPKLYEPLHTGSSILAWTVAGWFVVVAVPVFPPVLRFAKRQADGWRPAAWAVGLALALGANLWTIGPRLNARVALFDARASNSHSLMRAVAPLLPDGTGANREAIARARARAAERRTDLSGAPVLEDAHVLLVTIDALRADHLGAYGYDRDLTPNLDRFAAESVVFERAYAAAPHSSYSISSMMTSSYVHQLVELGRPLPTETLASLLTDSGYHTAAFYTRGVFHTEGERMRVYDESAFGFQRHDHANRVAESMADATLEELDRIMENGEPPSLLWSHFFDVHEPYRETSLGTSDIDRYDGELRNVDRAFRRLLEGLRARMTRPLIVAVTADHGEEFRDHGGLYHGSTLYEEQIRVPLILHVPGTEARRVVAPTSLVDLTPTLLALVGRAADPAMFGHDVRGRLDADPDPMPPVFGAVSYKKMVVRWPYKLVADLRFGLFELYDLSVDERERDNLAGTETELLEDLKGEIYAWLDGVAEVEDIDPNERALTLGRVRDRRAIEPLCVLLEDSEAGREDRIEAAQLLTKLTSRDARPALRRVMAGGDPLLAAEAAVALGRQRDQTAKPALERLVFGEEPSLRTRAAISLARLRDPTAVPALIDALHVSEERYEREEAVRWLGRLRDPSALEPLIEVLPDLRLRPLVVVALGDLGDPRAFGVLARTIRWETHSTVRDAVARALGSLGDARGIPLLIPLVEDVDLKYPGEALVRLGAVETGAVGGVDAESLEGREGFGDCEAGPLRHEWNYLARTVCTTTRPHVRVALKLPNDRGGRVLLVVRARRADAAPAAVVTVSTGTRESSFSVDGEGGEFRIPLDTAPRFVEFTTEDAVRLELDHVLVVPSAQPS